MHKSTISKKMNLLYVAVDPSLYTHYSAGEAYPTNKYPFPAKVDEVPDFSVCNNDTDRTTAKIMHAILLKMCNNVVNMNAALINALLSLIPTAFKLLYEQEWMMDPNAVFHQCLTGSSQSMDVLPPKIVKPIIQQWPPTGTPQWKFEVLTSRLFCGITFASLSGHPITDKDTVDIGVRVLNHTGLFAEEYKTWIL